MLYRSCDRNIWVGTMRNMTVRAASALACAVILASVVVCQAYAGFNSQLFTAYGFSAPERHQTLTGSPDNSNYVWNSISRIPQDNETVKGQLINLMALKSSYQPATSTLSPPSGTSKSSWLYTLDAPIMTDLSDHNVGRTTYDSFVNRYLNSSANIFEY
jgi:hypothetical protein